MLSRTPPAGNEAAKTPRSPWEPRDPNLAPTKVSRSAESAETSPRSAIGTTGLGQRSSRYEIVETIDRGGMGELFLAEVLEPNEAGGGRKYAVLKRLLADLLEDERYVAMFLAEARVLSRLDHPNIVKVFDVPVIDGKQCLAMEYVHGRNVQQILARCRVLGIQIPAQVALRIMCEVLAGLEYAHTYQLPDGRPLDLVHRDVTPGNVLVSFDGEVKVIDFGISKSRMSSVSTTVGVVKGTTRYLSPEQVRGDRVEPTSDLFSCASVLVEMFTGVPLFDRGSVPPTLLAIAMGERPKIERLLPFQAPLLAQVLERALSVSPSARYLSAGLLSGELKKASLEIGQPSGRSALGTFLRELFRDLPSHPLIAFPGDEGNGTGLDALDVTYLFEIRDPIAWGADKGDLGARRDTPELERARAALISMEVGARPLEASAFLSDADAMIGVAPLAEGAEDEERNRGAAVSTPGPMDAGKIVGRSGLGLTWVGRAILFALGVSTGIAGAAFFDLARDPKGEPLRVQRETSPPSAHPSGLASPASTPSPSPSRSMIDIASPRGARVQIDGAVLAERVPLLGFEIAPGRHRIVITKGRSRRTINVEVREGQRIDLSYTNGK